jgi:hypothetical protein
MSAEPDSKAPAAKGKSKEERLEEIQEKITELVKEREKVLNE